MITKENPSIIADRFAAVISAANRTAKTHDHGCRTIDLLGVLLLVHFDISRRYWKADESYKAPDEAIQKRGARNRMLASMIRQVEEIEGPVDEFDASLWGAFADRMSVMEDGNKVVRFKNGNEVTV